MRIALLDPDAGGLAAVLRDAGHDAEILERPRGGRLAEKALRVRGFDESLAQLPALTRALLRGRFDVVHAFSVEDAAAALVWRRLAGGTVVFTCTEVLSRERLAHRRLRLRMLCDAFERSDAVTAASEEAREAIRRWLALDAPVVDDFGQLYEQLRSGDR